MGDLVSCITSTNDLGFIAIGFTESFGATYGDYYLIRTDAYGDTLWTRNYGGENTEWGYSSRETDDGNFVFVGWSDSYYPPSGCNIYLMKTDPLGDTTWTQVYGGNNNDAAFDMQVTSDNGYIIVGSTESFGAGGEDVYLIKTKPDTLGISEEEISINHRRVSDATIFSGPLFLPKDEKCRVFDITGRAILPDNMRPGIYFIEVDGQITQKVVKVR